MPRTLAEHRPSKKQRETLSFVDNFISGHGYGPSYREIMRGLGYRSVATVALHVDNLIAKGYLRKRTHRARSLEVIDSGEKDFLSSQSSPTVGQQKWLVDIITSRFSEIEGDKMLKQSDIDELYVLVGALKVLGLDAATNAFIPRLGDLNLRIKKR